jgi:hypothetical protein
MSPPAAAGGLIGIKAFGGFIGDAREAREVIATLSQEIEVTGASAWTSVESIDAMANSIQSYTGISDETIKSNATMLLSFKSVKNQVGEGNAIFDRAIVSAGDLAQLMKTDMSSATLQLGKALEDPVKGISAMTRSGVTFTAEEKEKIKTLVESGEKLEAQGMIMEAVEGQSAGLARAAADDGDLMAAAWADMSQALGEALLPAMDSFAKIALPVLEFFTALPAPLQLAILAVPLVAAAFAVVGGVLPLVATGFGMLSLSMLPIVAGIALVVGAIYLLITHWDTLKEAGAAAWGWIQEKTQGFFLWLHGAVGWLSDAWGNLAASLIAPFRVAFDWIIGMWQDVRSALTSLLNIGSGPAKMGGRIPKMGDGGNVMAAGMATVGERGPETLYLPRGAVVEPLMRSGEDDRAASGDKYDYSLVVNNPEREPASTSLPAAIRRANYLTGSRR